MGNKKEKHRQLGISRNKISWIAGWFL